MSGPTPEYDLGTEEGMKQAQLDPGIPDELVEEIAQEPRETVAFNPELILETTPLVAACVMALVVLELLKALGMRDILGSSGFMKREGKPPLVKGLDLERDSKATVYRWALAAASFGTSLSFGFHTAILNLTGYPMSWFETVLYGTASVSLGAHVLYEWKLTQALKKRVYDFFGFENPDDSIELDTKKVIAALEKIASEADENVAAQLRGVATGSFETIGLDEDDSDPDTIPMNP